MCRADIAEGYFFSRAAGSAGSAAADTEQPDTETAGDAGDIQQGEGTTDGGGELATYKSPRYARAKLNIYPIELNISTSLLALDISIATESVSF